jgi:hypothetical protein
LQFDIFNLAIVVFFIVALVFLAFLFFEIGAEVVSVLFRQFLICFVVLVRSRDGEEVWRKRRVVRGCFRPIRRCRGLA